MNFLGSLPLKLLELRRAFAWKPMIATQLLTYETLALPAAATPDVPDESFKRIARFGWVIVGLFFGVFGTWAAIAPLKGAVVANAVVKVDGNRKSVQHLEGGIVKELRVKEGDRVAAGDVLVVLDESQARAEFEVLTQDLIVLRATEERLRAELAHRSEMTMPEDLKTYSQDPYLKEVWDAQVHQMQVRLAALDGQRQVIKEKIAQLEQQIVGLEGQVVAFTTQTVSVKDERASILPLMERGLVAKPRVLQLERTAAGLDGQIADARANIAKARQAIAEQMQQSVQLDNDRMTDLAKDLRDTQARLLEVIPKLMHAQAVLNRVVIRSPYSGRVVGLNVFSVGGVINRGDKIMDVVPDHDSLVIEAQVAVEDISEVHPDMAAEVHFTAYKQRTTPIVRGEVLQVSADRLTDKDNHPYFVALVRVDEKELAALPYIKLYPGMPATVMIPTVERTALDYLVGPLAQSFNRAFRQR
jgi:HlyD family type I secretion membrane fusion protein